jgi:hypothetical protein
MLKLSAAIAATMTLATPALAAPWVCMATDTPASWMQKTGQHAAATMEIAVGENNTTPAMLMIGDDGKFAFLFRGPDGRTCIMAVGDHAVVAPPVPVGTPG